MAWQMRTICICTLMSGQSGFNRLWAIGVAVQSFAADTSRAHFAAHPVNVEPQRSSPGLSASPRQDARKDNTTNISAYAHLYNCTSRALIAAAIVFSRTTSMNPAGDRRPFVPASTPIHQNQRYYLSLIDMMYNMAMQLLTTHLLILYGSIVAVY